MSFVSQLICKGESLCPSNVDSGIQDHVFVIHVWRVGKEQPGLGVRFRNTIQLILKEELISPEGGNEVAEPRGLWVVLREEDLVHL